MTAKIACVDVPALPLQLVLRRRPEWATRPVAVVADDRPQGLVLSINEAARRCGVRTGMRYGPALSLAPDLRADVVADEETAAAVAELTALLLRFTPGVEPAAGEPGVFFLDASGLARLHGPPEAWAGALVRGLAAAGLRSRVAVGFARFSVYAAAKTARGVVAFESEDEETRAARRTPLERLGVDPDLLDSLEKLGVRTVEDFLRLPEEGLLRRFGDDALRLRRFAAGDRAAPLARAVPVEPLVESAAWEHPATDAARVIFPAKRLLDRLLATAAARGEAVVEIVLRLVLDRHPPLEGGLRPAAPTLDSAQLLDLVHLRLAQIRLPSGVVAMTLTGRSVAATQEQIRLFVERPRRDPAAAGRAFARLRAEFGEDAVVVAHLRDGHLPEARFSWERLDRPTPARPRIVPEPPLVRRVLARPLALPPRPRHEPDGWIPRSPQDGPVVRVSGPYVVAGGWWNGAETRREYAFAQTARGPLLWTFFDARRRRWFVQGVVE